LRSPDLHTNELGHRKDLCYGGQSGQDLPIAGVPKHSLAVYPFSISIDEHVPLNMGARRNFFQGGASSGFSRGCGKVAKLYFHHSKLIISWVILGHPF